MAEWVWNEFACACGLVFTVGHPSAVAKEHDCPHCKTPMRVVSEDIGQANEAIQNPGETPTPVLPA